MTLTKPKQTRQPVNQRKRSGQHHRQSRHYIKAYWPYLPVFAVLGAGLLINTWISHAHHSVLGYATDISPQVLLAETNDQRTTRHESALQINQDLMKAAQAKANDMAKRDFWSHVTPNGRQPWSFMVAAGYQYEAAGENLAYGFSTSSQVMTAWMHSPEHRANILDGVYQDVGFGMANSPDYQGTGPETIVVAMYGEPTGMINASTGTTTSKPVALGTQTQPVSQLSLLSTATWAPMVIAAICGAALMLFFIRHILAWHKVLVRGEQFFLAHPMFDALLMSAAVLTLLLSHVAGAVL